MFDESCTQNNIRPKSKMARPKPVYMWTNGDVLKWYRRHCSEYLQYLELFSKVKNNYRLLNRNAEVNYILILDTYRYFKMSRK